MGREIRWEFVEVCFRNRLGNAQHFFPHRGRLFCFWHAALWAATFCGIGTHRRSCLHDGWNYSEECLRCLRAGLTVIGLVLLRSSNEARFPSRLFLPSLEGRSQSGFHCAHRATTVSSWGLCEQERRLASPLIPLVRLCFCCQKDIVPIHHTL